jgi:hypothetical protein
MVRYSSISIPICAIHEYAQQQPLYIAKMIHDKIIEIAKRDDEHGNESTTLFRVVPMKDEAEENVGIDVEL